MVCLIIKTTKFITPSFLLKKNIYSSKSSSIILFYLIFICLFSISTAYPAFYMQAIPRKSQFNLIQHSAQKRAFDRLDISPFDFDAMTKRFNDDELSSLPFNFEYLPSLDTQKRAFDRLEDSGFFGLRKRAFDRLDNSFMLIKKKSNK
ncbi:hypothetical protein Mgra_00005704 [Meloidogyne graminicola]|uniref:Uncharacterized protein n=1 Tax=Meloidogyne graminicola TaxID=189291 RepID=A0A8S9ZND9_9BILA|nr:hypothetical protein Mgra_00005704 [Meloidogyne graminicola]